MTRYLLFLLGMILALPILGLLALAFGKPLTISGIGYLSASLLAVSGLILAPWRPKYLSWLALAGLLGIVLIASARLIQASRVDANSEIKIIVLPQGKETRWISYMIDEQDTLILGETLFHLIGGDSASEHEDISSALSAAYSEMRGEQRIFPSPVISIYLDLQQPASFDAVLVEPEIKRRPEIAVVFLHGYMGNVTLQCWEIAQAVNKLGAVT